MFKAQGILIHHHIKSGTRTPDNTWAGVLWVAMPEGSSPLSFHPADDDVLDMTPAAGSVAFFPAAALHEAAAQRVDGRRVSVAFNVRPADG